MQNQLAKTTRNERLIYKDLIEMKIDAKKMHKSAMRRLLLWER